MVLAHRLMQHRRCNARTGRSCGTEGSPETEEAAGNALDRARLVQNTMDSSAAGHFDHSR